MDFQYILRRKRTKALIISAISLLILYVFRRGIINTGILILGASVITFIALPLCRYLEKKLARQAAALLSLMALACAFIAAIWIIVPLMGRQFRELSAILPETFSMLTGVLEKIGKWFSEKLGVSLPKEDMLAGMEVSLSGIAFKGLSFAANLAGALGRSALMVVLSFFFLCSRETLLLRLELMIPSKHRAMAVRAGNAILRDMRAYLRGQLAVAGAVAVLASAGLFLLGVSGALALGPLIGILNMIPYFGPFIGGIPAVLVALTESWQKACLAAALILIVQQLDNNFISPRIMSALTGIHPAFVLIAIFAGSQMAGIVGMLFALPVIMSFRTLFRVFVQSHENI